MGAAAAAGTRRTRGTRGPGVRRDSLAAAAAAAGGDDTRRNESARAAARVIASLRGSAAAAVSEWQTALVDDELRADAALPGRGATPPPRAKTRARWRTTRGRPRALFLFGPRRSRRAPSRGVPRPRATCRARCPWA